jgi:CheY-like chemotaxis protein
MAAKIMLVEDDNNLREIYEARLQAEGYSIVSARDGEEALVIAKNEQPQLVISDVMMPKISGFEMLDILRNTEGLKDMKVIMLTALGQAEDRTRANALGADRYLVKSQVTLEDIVIAAHELLDTPVVAVPVPQSTVVAAPVPVATSTTANLPIPVAAVPPVEPMSVVTAPILVNELPAEPVPTQQPVIPVTEPSPVDTPIVVVAAPNPPIEEPVVQTPVTVPEPPPAVESTVEPSVEPTPEPTPQATPTVDVTPEPPITIEEPATEPMVTPILAAEPTPVTTEAPTGEEPALSEPTPPVSETLPESTPESGLPSEAAVEPIVENPPAAESKPVVNAPLDLNQADGITPHTTGSVIAPNGANTETSPMTTAAEQAVMQNQIDDFISHIDGASSEPTATPSSPVEPTGEEPALSEPTPPVSETLPESTPESGLPVASTNQATTAQDAVMSDAVDDLINSTTVPSPSLSSDVSAVEVAPPPSARRAAVSSSVEAPPTVSPSSSTPSETGSVPIAHKKVIQPIDSGAKPDINALLAAEEAKSVMTTNYSPNGGFIADVTPLTTAVKPVSTPGFDPNSISL